MSVEEWLERRCPLNCVDPCTGKVCEPVFVEYEIGPDADDEEGAISEEAA